MAPLASHNRKHIIAIYIWTHCNVIRSTGIHKFHIIGICPWTNMPPTLHICLTALLRWLTYRTYISTHWSPKNQQTVTFNYHVIGYICASHKYAPQIPHMKISSCANMRQLIHILHMNSLQWTKWPKTLMYIHSHNWHMHFQQICLLFVHICSTALVM